MKKIIVLAVAATCAAAATAAEDSIVLKDTRHYDVHTLSLSGLEGCAMPTNPAAPKPGECDEKIAHYVKDGELLTLNPKTGFCTHLTWRQIERKPLSHQGHDISAPSMETRQASYECESDGVPVKKLPRTG